MPVLSSQDYQHLLEAIEIAHTIPERFVMLKSVFEKIEHWIGMRSAAFFPLDRNTHQFMEDGFLGYNASPETLHLFQTRFASLHPIAVQQLHIINLNEPLRLTDCLSAARLPDTEYGCDFQRRVNVLYELCMTLACQGDVLACMGLHRSRREKDFSAREIAFMRYLVPHLARALHNITLTETLLSGLDVGLVILGKSGKVLLINEAAKRALHGRPATAIPDPGASPDPAFFSTATGTYRILSRPILRGDRKVLFLDPMPSREHLRTKLACFDLTARQEEIALYVMQGYANREIAERLFITEQTVKDHLRDIFEKMAIRHRSELAPRVLGLDRRGRVRVPPVC